MRCAKLLEMASTLPSAAHPAPHRPQHQGRTLPTPWGGRVRGLWGSYQRRGLAGSEGLGTRVGASGRGGPGEEYLV